ncbi:hypothetical protein P153DRAFT_116600 [Dothidotthia symphoricarpi CBS 119687]|uniref:Uncharacterized protein n=1 Tax=Dothidotthia symphoricarpi CBS 119687 TaxID=1392245 RepID=A0A6A6A189_9PLEO|nr:uncharacterized protein P153DRAFT_116600 [Dothidotthia symphoricarpi CBS 119687]KAF2124924.1 hypothetical protein P153DRAFT_116600 [Dothidotthia symphoricarpi CBS 119687]
MSWYWGREVGESGCGFFREVGGGMESGMSTRGGCADFSVFGIVLLFGYFEVLFWFSVCFWGAGGGGY